MPAIPSRHPLETQTQKGVSRSEGLLTSTGLAMVSRPTRIAAPQRQTIHFHGSNKKKRNNTCELHKRSVIIWRMFLIWGIFILTTGLRSAPSSPEGTLR